jgi:manganese/zinc/iron transport system permease protein
MYLGGFVVILGSIDPVVRGPLFAVAFMAAASAMLGCIIIAKRQSLIGETLSHAVYPGFILGAVVSQAFLQSQTVWFSILPFLGAIAFAYMATYSVDILIRRLKVAEDSAQTVVLASTFALGLLIVSSIQPMYPFLARQMQGLLLGQAATMTDAYVYIAFFLFIGVLTFSFIFYRSYTTSLFDQDFSHLASLSATLTMNLFGCLLVVCIMVGIRSMGVVLMTALLVFPAVCARLLTRTFSSMIAVSAIVGSFSGIVGVVLAHTCCLFSEEGTGKVLWIPTGPLITLVLGGIFCILLLFSPQIGLVVKAWRRCRFSRRCLLENALKIMWKHVQEQQSPQLMKKQLLDACSVHKMTLRMLLRRLVARGYVVVEGNSLTVTPEGLQIGQKLVRLHRLWELYLVECCKMPKEKVHPTAEEMEHIFSEELEKQLTHLLNNPQRDPHDKPIPN